MGGDAVVVPVDSVGTRFTVTLPAGRLQNLHAARNVQRVGSSALTLPGPSPRPTQLNRCRWFDLAPHVAERTRGELGGRDARERADDLAVDHDLGAAARASRPRWR